MVVISASCSSIGSARQLRIGCPSISTAQAPHSPSSQPCLVPVRPRSSRSTSRSVLYAAQDSSTASPLTLRLSCRLRGILFGCQTNCAHCTAKSLWREGFARRRIFGLPRKENPMALRIGDEAPNFPAHTTDGPIDFHKWIGDKWAILFSPHQDIHLGCTPDLGTLA